MVWGYNFIHTINMKYKTENERQTALMIRLWAKILPVDSGCWEWQGSTDKKGYARISYNNYPELVSRVILSRSLS